MGNRSPFEAVTPVGRDWPYVKEPEIHFVDPKDRRHTLCGLRIRPTWQDIDAEATCVKCLDKATRPGRVPLTGEARTRAVSLVGKALAIGFETAFVTPPVGGQVNTEEVMVVEKTGAKPFRYQGGAGKVTNQVHTDPARPVEDHKKRHKILHRGVTELVISYQFNHPGRKLRETNVMELLEWSYSQTIEPTRKEVE